MTDCQRGDVRDLLPDLLHDRLDAATRAEVERHVARCAACTGELALLRAMRGALTRAPRVDAARIAAAIGSAGVAPGAPPVPVADVRHGARWRRWRAVAGIAAAALAVATWAVARGGRHGRQPLATDSGPGVTIARTPARGSGGASEPGRSAPSPAPGGGAVAPRSGALVPPSLPRQVAQLPRGLTVDGGVSDLTDGDVKELLQSIDRLDALPDAEPAPAVDPVDLGGQGEL